MRTLGTVLAAMLVFVALTATIWASGNATKASIVSSPHDFTSSTYTFAASGSSTSSSATTNLCFFCHILHKTATNSSGVATTSSLAPGYMMWNHQLSSQASYGVYSSDTFNAVLAAAGVAPPTDLGSNNNINSPTVSNLCLSCHDGTVAIASFYESGFGLPANGSTWNNGHGASTYMYTGMQISDLTKVHPVHFQYTPALASAAGITSPASPNSVDGSGAVPLYGGAYYMECTTCHDPHNGATAVHGSLFPFARSALASVSGSFCTYCHS